MSKQTAVEWLENQMTEYLKTVYKSELEQAKQMEKEQHNETWEGSFDNTIYTEEEGWSTIKTFDEYYKETFKADEIEENFSQGYSSAIEDYLKEEVKKYENVEAIVFNKPKEQTPLD